MLKCTFLYTSDGLPALEHVPEVGHFGTFLGQFVLVAHAVDRGFQHLGVTKGKMQGGFQRAQCGQRNNPVSEDTVMDAFLFHLDGKFPLGEGIHVGKVLLKQLPMFQNVEGQVGQAQVADGLQFLVMLFSRTLNEVLV